MSNVNRREAMVAITTGVVAAGVLMESTRGDAAMQDTKYEQKTQDALDGAIKAAKALAGPFAAAVGMSRSWDPHVYLVLDNGVKGYASLAERGHGVAAACQAAGRKVFMKYTSHDPNWGNGAGYFQGVQVALDSGVF